jgi:Family of unknown function (DUF6193)
MGTPTDPGSLYPDIASRGSLAAALEVAAKQLALAIPVTAAATSATFATPDAMLFASVESRLPHRNPLRIRARDRERKWSISGAESYQDLALLDGHTDDLAELARAAHAWHTGTALDEIRQAVPFVHLTGRFEVPDRDPVRLTASEWECLRTEARELVWDWAPAFHALIEAAYAEPALRRLYPFTSHWALRFATSTSRQIYDAVGPLVITHSAGRYSVRADLATDEVLAEATSAVSAIAATMRFMPADITGGRDEPGHQAAGR